ncbi:MAG: flagellar hook-associated protein FlgL [bacterium]
MDFRLTNRVMYDRLIRNINANREELYKLEEALYTGKKINRPSDDPGIYMNLSSIKTQMAELAQYKDNCDYGEAWLDFSYATLDTYYERLMNAKDIAYQASNDTSTGESREIFAQIIGDLHDELIGLANTELYGRYIFGGSNGNNPPVAYIDANGAEVPYESPEGHWRSWEDNGIFEISIGSNNNTINIGTSASVFLEITDGKSVFDILAGLENSLATNDGEGIRDSLSHIDAALDTITQEQSNIGSKIERLTYTREYIEGLNLNLNRIRSAKEDTNVAETSVEISALESNYQTILAATTKTMNMSLFDLLY